MRARQAGRVGSVAAVLVCTVALGAQGGATVGFPEGYRTWVHVKSTLIGPSSPAFARNGGVHHFHANEKALEGYRTGTFPDGSVLIDDLVEAKETAGVTSDGARRRLAVMQKDSGRFASTGGWGFEIFPGDTRQPSLDAAARGACFECHKGGRDSVFTEFKP